MEARNGIDNGIFVKLIRNAVEMKNYHSAILGEYVSSLVQIVLKEKCFVGYTEDWRLEMYSEGCLAVFNALPNAELDEKRIYNYLYTCARNRIGKTIVRLKNEFRESGDSYDKEIVNSGNVGDVPVYVRNKRHVLKGYFDRNKRKALESVTHQKMAMLKNAVGRAARRFSTGLDIEEINRLTEFSRKSKEAYA